MTIDKVAVKAELDADTRNISGLWNQAVEAYNATTGIPLAGPHFKDTKDMIRFGTEGAEQFQSWRHGDKRVDKLRSLFMQNIDFIEAGAKQLVAAASASFPPAAAIGTAMTLVLSGVKAQKADYDAVVNFFEDMNNFLQRVTIIEKRVPRKKAYQNALMDVFASLLHMCAVAHKFIALGRFKKWAINTVLGGDSELAGGRSRMDKTMKRLESATEFAILDNSENMLEKQDVLGNSLASFQQELRRNQTVQERLAQTQAMALENISTGIQDLSVDLQDIKRLLQSRTDKQNPQETVSDVPVKVLSSNPVKALLSDYLDGPDATNILSDLRQTRIAGTGEWVFENPDWLEWTKGSSAQIAIQGNRGVGKTHLSVAVYEHFHRLAQEDSGGYICPVYFQFRSNDDSSNYMMAGIAAFAIQMVDQNVALRQQLFSIFQQEEVLADIYENWDDECKIWDVMLSNIFGLFKSTSEHQLFVVFDSLDELRDDEEVDRFNDLVGRIEEQHLRVKVVATRTSARNFLDGPVIAVGQAQFRLDLRELIKDRLHNSDSMYGGIRRLTKHTKQRLARKLEQHADGLLYAEQMLRFLGSFQRQTAVENILDGQMPVNVAQIYDMMLARAQSRINAEYLPAIKSVITWAAFSFRPLSLKEVGQIAAIMHLEEGVAEDIISERLKSFFETSCVEHLEFLTPVGADVLFDEELTTTPFGDEKFQLNLRDDSMKSFFGDDPDDGALRTTVSLAHYRIFLTSLDTISESESKPPSTLDHYVAQFCLKHWYQIESSELPGDEQAIACRYFANLIIDGHWSKNLAKLPADVSMTDVLGEREDFVKAWTAWSELAENLDLDEKTRSYWRLGPDNALWPLAKSFLHDWLRPWDRPTAIRIYNLARATIKYTSYRRFLDQSFDYDSSLRSDFEDGTSGDMTTFKEISALATASELPTSAESHFAIGAVLSFRGDHQGAISEYQSSLEMSNDRKFRIRSQVNIAFGFRQMEDWEQTVLSCDVVLSQHIQPSSTNESNDKLKQSADVPDIGANASSNLVVPAYRSWALIMKAGGLDYLKQYGNAARYYRDARLCNAKIAQPGDLLRELICLWRNENDYNIVMDTLMHDFKAIERLNLLTSDLSDDEDSNATDLIRLAALKTGRQDDMVKLYKEIIKTLDTEEAGAPLRLDLAESQWLLQHDLPAVKALLNQIFDSVHDTMTYKLTERAVVDVVVDSTDLMVTVLLKEFRRSSNAEDKVQIMLELKDLPNRSLPSCAVLTPSNWHGCRLALARMLQKIGPASEFQAVINQVFEECLINLRDATEANDSDNVFMLAKVLGMAPNLQRYAELMFSALNQELSPQKKEHSNTASEAEDDAYGAVCDGKCLPRLNFIPWDRPAYICLVCTNSWLCEDCHRTRMEWNSGSKPDDEPDFCCDHGMYLKGPIEGWQGMEGGVMSIRKMSGLGSNGVVPEQKEDSIETIEFTKLLEDVEVAWKKAWEDHWAGF